MSLSEEKEYKALKSYWPMIVTLAAVGATFVKAQVEVSAIRVQIEEMREKRERDRAEIGTLKINAAISTTERGQVQEEVVDLKADVRTLRTEQTMGFRRVEELLRETQHTHNKE